MNALVVRELATGKIVACGPADGMYDPWFNAATQTKGEEPEYELRIGELLLALAAQPKPRTMHDELTELRARVTALEDRLK